MEVTQEALDRIIGEMKLIHEESIHHMREGCLEQLNQVKEHYEDKVKELLKQTDGLLGAVGRLQGERDEATKKLEENKAKERQREQDFQMQTYERVKLLDQERREMEVQVASYKLQIADLQIKLKKQTKK